MDQPRRALVDPPPVEPFVVAPSLADHRSRPPSPARPLEPIRISHLTKRFGTVVAVDDLSVEVAPGRVTGLLGPNGAGKTTTLRILLGLVAPSSGSTTFGETAYADLDRPQRRVGSVLEAVSHPGRTGRDQLRVLAATAEVGRERVDEVLELVGLTGAARRRTGTYSLGMRQRLALAGALLGDPDYLVLDEPANGLDPEGIRWLRGFLREFAAAGRTVLISSHVLGEVQAIAADVIVMAHGGLLRQLRLDDAAGLAHRVRLRVRRADTARAALGEHEIGSEAARDEQGEFLLVDSDDPASVGQLMFAAGVPVYELTRQRRDLEQEFFALLAEQDGSR